MINKQPHKSSCGPVVVMNAIKLLGGSLPYRKYVDLFKTLYWTTGGQNGQCPKYVSSGLKLFGIKYKKKMYPVVSDIEEAIDRGNAVILLYKWYRKGRSKGHYVLIDKHTPKRFRAYNNRKNGSSIQCKKQLRYYMSSSKKTDSNRPQMWEIII